MQKLALKFVTTGIGLLVAVVPAFAAPLTTYHAIDKRAPSDYNSYDNRYNHQYRQHHYPKQGGYGVQIQLPHVSVQLNSQPSYSYEKTEEVYLPYGGTYRKSTSYQSVPSNYIPRGQHQRRIVQQGHYVIDDEPFNETN